MRSDVSWNKWIESKFFDWDSKLRQLSLISLDHVRVSLSDLLEGSLDLSDSVILQLLYFFESRSNHAQRLWVDTGSGK